MIKNICYLLKQPKELQEQVFTKFFEEARIGMFDGEQRFAYMLSQKHYWDNLSTIHYSYEKGMKKGIEEGMGKGRELGKAEALKEIAQKMRSNGMSQDRIDEMIGMLES